MATDEYLQSIGAGTFTGYKEHVINKEHNSS